ncbi:hypothetical protein E1200_32640 [Actinomadura sp. GC306]|uniref:hypothetical protein n=1 Tax=Actinomadura sp. GC306 TaxID=2530367 RepID=UPI0010540670|nr:hypothetical protein [Actinomadura sp. GC306]TDC59017.1 hypothetical protein E1200_32640 [Actinomadura sp. GC306]
MDDLQRELVLRPALTKGLAVLSAAAIATAGIVTAILAGDAPPVLALIVGIPFAALIPLALAALLRTRITLTPDELIERGPFSKKRRPRSQIAEVVQATIIVPERAHGENLFVLDPHRNPLFRISTAPYTHEDLGRLIRALDVPHAHLKTPIRAKDFTADYPNLITKTEKHPYRLAFAVIAVACVVAIGLALTLR